MSAAVISTAPRTSTPSPNPRPRSAGSSRTAASAVAMPIGMLTKKIQCQLMASAITPPTISPIEPPAEATKA